MDTSYKSPIQKKDIPTINNSAYYESEDQVDTISDTKEQVDPRSNPRLDTHITTGIQKLSIRPITIEPVIVGHDLVTSVLETSRDGLLLKSLKSIHKISVKEIFTDTACSSVQVDKIAVRTPSRAIHRTPGVNVDVFIPIRGSNSSFAKWPRNIEPLNTSVD